MTIYITLLWILAGWCGSEPRIIYFPFPFPPIPDPEPPPRPEWSKWFVPRIIGAVTGLIGGWGFVQAFGPRPEPWLLLKPHPEPWVAGGDPVPWAMAVFAATTAVGAFVVSRVVTDIYGQLSRRR
jgi:hypothetical protein